MGKRISRNTVCLDDGTLWSVDLAENDEDSLEWILRYGTPDQVESLRLVIASVLSSYTALLHNTYRRRNAVMSEIMRTLEVTPLVSLKARNQPWPKRGADK